jgi:Zn-dependent alcohol dehydrogenase
MVAAGTFADRVVVPGISVVPIDPAMPFAPASLLGCAVLTGAGAALNTASIREGDTVVVLGCGTVGLMAVQGARLRGAGRIVAVDLLAAKLDIATKVGATDVLHAGEADVLAAVADLTHGRGADVALECAGAQVTVNQAIRLVGKGGEVVFIGAGAADVRIDVPQFVGLVGPAKTFKGCLYGSADTRRDIPLLVEHYLAGELHLDVLVSRTYALDEVNDGLGAVAAGEVISAVVQLGPPETHHAAGQGEAQA